MKQQDLFFPSGSLKLEGSLLIPTQAKAAAGTVICHPHPLYGGCMNNNVIYAISEALAGEGIISLRFNFRGVGRSEGGHDGVQGEIDDALAALDFLAGFSGIAPARLALAGYSFGGAVVLQAGLQRGSIGAVAAVSPHEIPDLSTAAWPRLLLCGSEDNLVYPTLFFQQKENIAGRDGADAVEVIAGADHFWYGYEKVMAGRVASFFQRYLFGEGP